MSMMGELNYFLGLQMKENLYTSEEKFTSTWSKMIKSNYNI